MGQVNEFFRIVRDFLWELLWTAVIAWLVVAVVAVVSNLIETFFK